MNSLNLTTVTSDSTEGLRLDLAQLFIPEHFIVSREPDSSYLDLIKAADKSIKAKQKSKKKGASLHLLYQ